MKDRAVRCEARVLETLTLLASEEMQREISEGSTWTFPRNC
jgi:hypothetical protein